MSANDYDTEPRGYDDEGRGYEREPSRSPRGGGDSRARSASPDGRGDARPPMDKQDDEALNPGTNLFVTGIHPRLSEREVVQLFEKYGEVEKCNIMRDPHSGDSRGFGFVKMVTAEHADAARDALQGVVHEGRTLSIEKARRNRPRTPTPGKYYGPPKREFGGRPRGGGRFEDRRGGFGRRDDYYGGGGGYRGGSRYGGDRGYDDRGYDDRSRYRERSDYGRPPREERYPREDRYGGGDRRGGGGPPGAAPGGYYRDDARGNGGGYEQQPPRDARETYGGGRPYGAMEN